MKRYHLDGTCNGGASPFKSFVNVKEETFRKLPVAHRCKKCQAALEKKDKKAAA